MSLTFPDSPARRYNSGGANIHASAVLRQQRPDHPMPRAFPGGLSPLCLCTGQASPTRRHHPCLLGVSDKCLPLASLVGEL